MSTTDLVNRVEILEHTVNTLERLPARVDALSLQVVQLRDEMRDGFSALREEMHAGDEETRALVRALNEETRTHMRILHEDVVERIECLGEERSPSPRAEESGSGARPRRKRSSRRRG